MYFSHTIGSSPYCDNLVILSYVFQGLLFMEVKIKVHSILPRFYPFEISSDHIDKNINVFKL